MHKMKIFTLFVIFFKKTVFFLFTNTFLYYIIKEKNSFMEEKI